jgi:hypothetical protein
MNWKLIFLLSLFGLAMSFATVFWIPLSIEFLFWIAIFIFCAYILAKKCTEQYFLHGFLVSVANSIWINCIHIYYFHTYLYNHPKMAVMMSEGLMSGHPRRIMAITGPLVGIVSGVVLGLMAVVASKLVKKQNTQKNMA